MNGELETLVFVPLQTKLSIRGPLKDERYTETSAVDWPRNPPTVVETNTNTAVILTRMMIPYVMGDSETQHLPVNTWVFSEEDNVEQLSSSYLTYINYTLMKEGCEFIADRKAKHLSLCNLTFFFTTFN